MGARIVAAGSYIALAALGLAVLVELFFLALLPAARERQRRPEWRYIQNWSEQVRH